MIGLLCRPYLRVNSASLRIGLSCSYCLATAYMGTISSRPPSQPPRCFLLSQFSSRNSSTMSQVKPLRYEDGPLVWIDLETTGLDPARNRIIEVAVLITDGNLELVDEEGCKFVVKSDENRINEMDEWCKTQHTSSGLLAQINEATHTAPQVAEAILEYIKRWVPQERTAHLAGSSVHFDAMFLRATGPDVAEHDGQMIWNKVANHLHYRIVDVSSIKELCKRWYPNVYREYQGKRPAKSSHRAMDDIRQSIAELKFYREMIFVNPEGNDENGNPKA
ncbi:hypothetical protein FRC08_004850 [Ceratobasidium sp. 394]|nr:hypothetical protein FRC08_004850 [Ceratobasidium sp. 394]